MRQLYAGLAGAAFLIWSGAALAQTSGCATPGSHYDVYGNPCMGLDSSGGGGGGAVTGAAGSFVDGWNLTLGTKADSAWSGTGSATEIAIDKAIYGALGSPFQAGGSIGNTAFGTTPTRASTTSTNGTITTGNTFQSVLASNTSRLGCLITNTSTSAESVALGASPSAANSIPLAAGAQFSCASPGGTVVVSDQVNLTSATAGATWVVWAQ